MVAFVCPLSSPSLAIKWSFFALQAKILHEGKPAGAAHSQEAALACGKYSQ
jgi:hypothetical protein